MDCCILQSMLPLNMVENGIVATGGATSAADNDKDDDEDVVDVDRDGVDQ